MRPRVRTSVRVAVLQPSYLPWLGYLHQLASCDAFVFYDDVQYDKNGWRNRNRIRTASDEGWSWLTIPVLVAGYPRINEVTIDDRTPWRRKHLTALRHAYSRARHYELFDEHIAPLYDRKDDRLSETAIESIRLLARAFGITTQTFRSSELNVTGDRNTRLLAICRHFGADEYLSGIAAQSYLDVGLFENSGIRVLWQEFQHPVYEQQFPGFVSHLSALDALLNAGPLSLTARNAA